MSKRAAKVISDSSVADESVSYSLLVDSLFIDFNKNIAEKNFPQAMDSLHHLHMGIIDVPRDANFPYEYFIKPVLEHKLMHIAECAHVVKRMELYVVDNMHETHAKLGMDIPTEWAFEMGRAGLSSIGYFMFMRSVNASIPYDNLYRAEALFQRAFSPVDLMAFDDYQKHENVLPALTYLYLKRGDAFLPFNNPRTVMKSHDCYIFSMKINDPKIFSGIGRVMEECHSIDTTRKKQFINDLMDSFECYSRDSMRSALIKEVGEEIVLAAENLKITAAYDTYRNHAAIPVTEFQHAF